MPIPWRNARRVELTQAEVQALRNYEAGQSIARPVRRRLEQLGALITWKGRLVVSPAGLDFLEDAAPRSEWPQPGSAVEKALKQEQKLSFDPIFNAPPKSRPPKETMLEVSALGLMVDLRGKS